MRRIAGVAELVYAPALGADGETHGGSSPLPSTKTKWPAYAGLFSFMGREDLKAGRKALGELF